MQQTSYRSGISRTPLPDPEIGIPREKAYEKAWKYVGYKGFTRFISSDGNFFFIRQYRALNARAILAMQDYILELEDRLNELDENMSRETASDQVHNGSYRQESSRDRMELIWEIQRRLKDYSMVYFAISISTDTNREDDFINSYSQIAARARVSIRDIRSVKNWTDSWPNAIKDEEIGYVDQSEDLVYVMQKQDGLLNRKFKDFATIGRPWFRRSPKGDVQPTMENVHLYDEERAESFFGRIMMLFGLLMLISPLWILEFVSRPLPRLGIITSFVLLFYIFLSLMTTARPSECLAAAAGYEKLFRY
jgi:hypothetical protein